MACMHGDGILIVDLRVCGSVVFNQYDNTIKIPTVHILTLSLDPPSYLNVDFQRVASI